MIPRKIIAAVAAVAALALTQQACSGGAAEKPAEKPAESAAPAQATTAPGEAEKMPEATATTEGEEEKPPAESDPVLAGKRQVVLKPVQLALGILVLDKGRLIAAAAKAESALFVLTPSNGKHLIRSAKVVPGGAPECLQINDNGSKPLTVRAAACDAGNAGQLFTIEERAGRGYSIAHGDAFLQVYDVDDEIEVIAKEGSNELLRSHFIVEDHGPSTLPALR